MSDDNTNPNALDLEEMLEGTDIPRRLAVRMINDYHHASEIHAGLAYSRYDHRHEAPDRIGVFRSTKAVSY